MKKLLMSTVAGAILATGAFADNKTSASNYEGFKGGVSNFEEQIASAERELIGTKNISIKTGRFYDKAGVSLEGDTIFYANMRVLPFYIEGDFEIGTNSQKFSEGSFFNATTAAKAYPFYWGADTDNLAAPLGVIVKATGSSIAYENDGNAERTSDFLLGAGFSYNDPIFNTKLEVTYAQGLDNEIESEKEASLKMGAFTVGAKRTLIGGNDYDSFTAQYSHKF